jgi:putative addiction module component (TIGR02574 family)
MATRLEDLLDSALELPPADRARIAAELIASLDGEAEAGVDAAWVAEVDRRMRETARGEVQLVDREAVTSEIRETLRRG